MNNVLQLEVSIHHMEEPYRRDLISDLNFSVSAGGFISLIGPSGAGKSTLLRIIAGLEKRFVGEVRLDGHPVSKAGRKLQIVFQDYRLLPWKTTRANLAFVARDALKPSSQSTIEKWLRKVKLEEVADDWPKTLSGGQKGRLAFARTFIDPPRVLLLDEPFRSLDQPTKWELQDTLNEAILSNSTTVVLVSHSIDDAVYLSDVVHLLSRAPMRIVDSFEVDVRKPRLRQADQLSRISKLIGSKMQQMRESEKNRAAY